MPVSDALKCQVVIKLYVITTQNTILFKAKVTGSKAKIVEQIKAATARQEQGK
jgi:hypothetical protein